jgi:hypothetical protein
MITASTEYSKDIERLISRIVVHADNRKLGISLALEDDPLGRRLQYAYAFRALATALEKGAPREDPNPA